MVALIVGLKLTLLKNGLKRSVWRTVGLIVGMVYALGVVLAVLAGLTALRFASIAITADVTVLVFSLLSLGWLMMSLLVFGVDETVDPRKFALLPLRARQLLPGLLVSGLIGSPGIATALVSLGLVISWSRGVTMVLAAVISVPLGVATCFLLSRAGTSAFAQALASRRFRDFAAVALALVAAGVAVIANLFGGFSGSDPDQLRSVLARASEVLGWTPFGWAWSLPADVARGEWLVAGIHLILAAGLVTGLWFSWAFFLDRNLTSPLEQGGEGRKIKTSRHLAERLYPATPAGAIAGRSLRYWRRDPRYLGGIAGMLIAPVVIMISQLANPAGSREIAAFAPVLLGLLVGITIAQDLSYDGSAVWLHISIGVRGIDDRAGRIMSMLTILIPVQLILLLVAMITTGNWHLLPAVLGLMVGFTLIGLGVGCWVGALWQAPAPPPGASPFQKSSGGGLEGLLSFSVCSGLSLVFALPVIAATIGSFWIPWLSYVALALGTAIGLIVLRVGIVKGGALLDRRWPEVLAKVTATA